MQMLNFFSFSVLEISPGVGHPGGIKWQLLLCLVLSWIIVFLCLCKGVKSSGKVIIMSMFNKHKTKQ